MSPALMSFATLRKLCPNSTVLLPFGDLNLDGSLNETDVKLLQDYLHKKDVHIYANADLNNDGVWNVIDLASLKRLVKQA